MNKAQNQDAIEIDVYQLLMALWHKMWLLVITAVVFGSLAFFGTHQFVTPKYRASALMYVNNSSLSLGSTKVSITSADLSAAKSLVDTYIVIMTTRSTLNEVIQYANLDYSYEELKGMISASSVNSTEIFRINVTCSDPDEAEKIANTIAMILPEKISDVVEGSSVRIVDYAVKPAQRYSPSYSRNALTGALLGVLVSAGAIIIRVLFDVTIRSEQYLTQTYNLPVLSVIPDMRHPSNSGRYGKKYGNKYYRRSYTYAADQDINKKEEA